ncbi:MAG: type II secretion system F family protein [Lachnospiraceae bacterium]|nr:type II secretion system F family protein [Lachnospiraceae bacterium]
MTKPIRRAVLLFLAGLLLTAAAAYRDYRSDTLRAGYVPRGNYGSDPYETEARVHTENETFEITIPVAPRLFTDEEADALLRKAEEELPGILFSGQKPDKIEKALVLPETLEEGMVRAVWSSDAPEILLPDGSLGGHAAESGSSVLLRAELSLQNRTREVSFSLTVYPEKLSDGEAFSQQILEAVRLKDDRTKDRLFLPDTVGTERISWSAPLPGTPFVLLLLSGAAAVLSVYAAKSREEEEKQKREDALMLDYPSVTGKLVLLLHAGLSARSAVRRIAADYRNGRDHGRPPRPGYEEFVLLSADMNRGVTELEAYRGLGRRIRLPAYRTLSALLVQNLTKGSRTLLEVLDKEAGNAWEERRKRARIRGEKAGLKLLFPMMIQLGIVLVIMIVPAFMTLY